MKIKKGETYGEFVKRIRYTAHLTQEDFALRLGYTRQAVGLWEHGREPSLATKREIDEFARKIKE